VFLSYRREDGEYVRRLSDSLASHLGPGRLVTDISIVAGVDWYEAIETAISETPVVLAVIGPSWAAPWRETADGFLRRELAVALAKPGGAVIPVAVGGATLPAYEQLPDELAPLFYRQVVTVNDSNWEQDVAHLTDTIEYWFTMPMLGMQAEMQRQSAQFATISAAMSQSHEAVKDTIGKIR
jgi:hypothetical protein